MPVASDPGPILVVGGIAHHFHVAVKNRVEEKVTSPNGQIPDLQHQSLK